MFQSAVAENVDPDLQGLHWAWSPNVAWLDAQPHGPGGLGLHAEGGIVHGWMWSPSIGWISAHCQNTSSCQDLGYGLRLELDPDQPGQLRLSGTAWSSNVGWIVTDCRLTSSCASVDYALRVNPASGLVHGWAWSSNIGWISFSCANDSSCDEVAFGIRFDPAAFSDLPFDGLFSDRFEQL